MISKIYKINNSNKEELKKITEIFSNNFVNEPQYKSITKNTQKIKQLIKIQTSQLLQNKNNSIEIYSTSDKLKSIIILINCRDKRYTKSIFSNKKTINLFSKIKKHFTFFQTLKILSHTIKTNNIYKNLIKKSDYILYELVVDEIHIGTNQANRLLTPILHKFDTERLTVALNTHRASNTHIYEHFGFRILNIQTHQTVKNYQMVRRPQIKQIRVVENNLK